MGGYQLNTIQTSYVPLRSSEVTTAESPLDSTTPGSNLWDMTNKDRFHLGEEANAVEIFFAGEMTDGAQSTCHIWGQAKYGPAEKLCEISLTAGSAFFEGQRPGDTTKQTDNTTYLCVDTIAMDSTNDFHIRDISYYDTANNRISKLNLDIAGLEWILCEFTQVAAANQPTRITPYGRFW